MQYQFVHKIKKSVLFVHEIRFCGIFGHKIKKMGYLYILSLF